MAYGHDDSVVYMRDHLTFSDRLRDNEVPPVIRELRKVFDILKAKRDIDKHDRRIYRWFVRLPSRFNGKDCFLSLSPANILFCGKHIPVIKCVTEFRGGVSAPATDWFYDADSIMEHFKKHGVVDNTKTKWSKESDIARVKRWFDDPKQYDVNWLIEHKVSCVVMDPNGDIQVNPPLRDYQFYRKMDAYTTYQELDMWISGTLAYPQNMMVEVEDKYRIMAHGFDMKYGFRKRPE